MPIKRVVAVLPGLFALAAITGCGGPAADRPGAFRAGCEEASAQGVSQGRALASIVARANLVHQGQDLKGFMLKDGYRTVVQKAARVECHPYPLGLGLTQCVARARLCSR